MTQKLSDIVAQERDIVIDIVNYPDRHPVDIMHERNIDVDYVNSKDSRVYMNKHIEQVNGEKRASNRLLLRNGEMFVHQNELVIPLSYFHDHRKVYGGTYVIPCHNDAALPHLLHKQLRNVHALDSYTPYMRSLEQMAYVDPLTDLGNKRARDEYMKSVQKGSLLAIDINRFKQVNDSFGHEHGNSVLAELGVLIDRYFMRSEDRGFRWGGEEFTVVLPNTPLEHAQVVAKDFYAVVATHQFSTDRVEMLPMKYIYTPRTVTVSIGTATIEEGLQIADARLYQAKAVQRMREAKQLHPLSPQLEFPVS